MKDENPISWLDYTLYNNPQGVLKVLSEYGYIGILAPQSIDDARDCALELMDQYEDEGTIALLKAHPEYGAFSELFNSRLSNKSKYRNAISGVGSKIDSLVSKLTPINQAFVAIGVFVVVYYIVQETKKQ
jgi:hypothetical protein